MTQIGNAYTIIYTATGKPYSGCGHAHRSIRTATKCFYQIQRARHRSNDIRVGRVDGADMSLQEATDVANWMVCHYQSDYYGW